MNNRNITIDIAKGLGIILVVLGHNWIAQENSKLFNIIFSFHMPLFFFLAGIFIDEKNDIFNFIVARADTLLKPYFSVLIILGFFKIITSILASNEINFNVGEYFYGVIYATGNTIDWVVLWFLPHLFITSIISLGIIKVTSWKSGGVWPIAFASIVLLFIGIYFITLFWHPVVPLDKNYIGVSGYPGLPWSVDLIPITSAYIVIGYLLSNQVRNFNFNIYGFLTSVGIFSFLHYSFNEKIDLNLRIYGDPMISVAQSFFGIYIILCMASLLSKSDFISKKIAYIGSGSLYILIFHIIFQFKALNAMSRISSNSFINSFVALAFGVLLPLIFLEISRRNKVLAWLLLPSKLHRPFKICWRGISKS